MIPQSTPTQTPQNARHAGVIFESGGSYLVLPSLSLKGAEDMAPQMDFAADKEKPWAERKAAMLEVILQAARRNYPDCTIEDLREHLSLDTLGEAYQAAQGLAGLPKTHNAAGEFKPAAKNG